MTESLASFSISLRSELARSGSSESVFICLSQERVLQPCLVPAQSIDPIASVIPVEFAPRQASA